MRAQTPYVLIVFVHFDVSTIFTNQPCRLKSRGTPEPPVYAKRMKPLPEADLEHIAVNTAALWSKAEGKRLLISGGTGFFGVWLLESLLYCDLKFDLHLRAAVVSRDPRSFCARFPHLLKRGTISFVQGDVRNFAPPPGEFDFVIHAAAPSNAHEKLRPQDLLSTILDGTRNMLVHARERCAKKFLFVSSGAVYGPQPGNITHIPEDFRGGGDWLNPDAVYAEGKRVAEQSCALCGLETEIQIQIARCFAFVGPHLPLDQHFAIGNFIGDALAGRDICIRGDGTPMRSYLYAADLAVWLWTLLLTENHSHQRLSVVNVGSDDAIAIRDLAQIVIEELNPHLKIRVAGRPVADAPRLQYVPSIERAEALYGLRPMIGLREAIRRTAAWNQ